MSSTQMNNRTLTAVFDDMASAESAAQTLATRVAGVRGNLYSSQDNGDFSALGLPQEDRGSLEEAMRRGQVVLSAQVPQDQFQAACDVLEQAGAVDMDQQESSWREQGWNSQGTTGATQPAGMDASAASSTAAAERLGSRAPEATGRASMGATAQTGAAANLGATGRDEAIPVVEERLVVGKRETAHGRVRIRSYVTETPAEAQVRLHQEHVDVQRRPADRPVTDADRAFQDRTIEATERAEEAVVGKEARVVEEVVVRKSEEDRTETVRDTVRRTQVEVEDERHAGTNPATRPTNPDRR